jgi:putative hydrolase of the HAD superfamily
MINLSNFKVIAFDADDTLWVNEPNYRKAEDRFCELMSGYGSYNEVSKELFKIEMQNLELYGYGAKSFTLSMIETANELSANSVKQQIVKEIINLGKNLISEPVELLEGVKEVMDKLFQKGCKLVVATKGDLLDQERKLRKSSLQKYFHHVEIMSEKKEADYDMLLSNLEITPNEFLMIGNSLKSDIIPVLNIGGSAIHIPYHTNWQYELDAKANDDHHFITIKKITDILKFIENGSC